MVGNVIVKGELFLTLYFRVFAPTKKKDLIRGGHLNFSNTLRKSPAHLHMVGNVIVKFK